VRRQGDGVPDQNFGPEVRARTRDPDQNFGPEEHEFRTKLLVRKWKLKDELRTKLLVRRWRRLGVVRWHDEESWPGALALGAGSETWSMAGSFGAMKGRLAGPEQ